MQRTAPNQRRVRDTTEFVIGSIGKLYHAVNLDLFSRVAVGWAVSAVNEGHQTIKPTEMSLKRRCSEPRPIARVAARAARTACANYQALLDARGIVCSMSRRRNCHDNDVMESCSSTVQQ